MGALQAQSPPFKHGERGRSEVGRRYRRRSGMKALLVLQLTHTEPALAV